MYKVALEHGWVKSAEHGWVESLHLPAAGPRFAGTFGVEEALFRDLLTPPGLRLADVPRRLVLRRHAHLRQLTSRVFSNQPIQEYTISGGSNAATIHNGVQKLQQKERP